MMYIPGCGWYVILGLSLMAKQREVFKVPFCKWEKVVLREKKWYWLTNLNMVKPGKYDHKIYLFYNITTYTTIFNLVGWCMWNNILDE